MVLSLPVPSFSRSSASPPRPADANTPAPQPRQYQASASGSSTSSSSSRNVWRPPGLGGQTGSSSSSYSVTLSEALRNNPFGSTRSRDARSSIPEAGAQHQEQEELNAALETLARIFPDVRIEVFRELLVRFDGLSRLQVCVEQLLRNKEEWVAGRWNISKGQNGEESEYGGDGAAHRNHPAGNDRGGSVPDSEGEESLIPPEERFRSEEYKISVRTALSKEFSGLNKSTIEGVMAEVNFNYARARVTLQDTSRRTWRATLTNIMPSFKRKKDRDEHPLVVWQRGADGELVPRLKETGCSELDSELHEMLLAPVLRQKREDQEDQDFRLASELNEKEATATGALYECECCFADVTFEQIATCSADAHINCYNCIQRTIHEALFGQGWGKSVDLEHSTLTCLAPLSVGSCDGCLHPQVVRRAILLNTAGFETFRKFEDRLASEALLKSQLKLIRCPFCSYAEIDPVYHPSPRGVRWRIRRDGGFIPTILMTAFLLDMVPLLMIPFFIMLLLKPAVVKAIFNNSIHHICLKTRPKRFSCASPSCRRVSCMTCKKPWRDPHVCNEPMLLDLRATVEAARTAAVKRTCPRCSLSFVKSSGCNKLTCVCGYSMCYLCRTALAPPPPVYQGHFRRYPRRRRVCGRAAYDGPADNHGDHPGGEQGAGAAPAQEFEPEGYKHFCEHFRINPGSRCTECTKCDLYQAEDEEAVARRAGEKAEREWRIRQGVAGDDNTASALGVRNVNLDLSFGTEGKASKRRASASPWDLQLTASGRPLAYWFGDVWIEGRWKIEGQALVDWVVERVIVIEDV
ncbi:hypothetical protein NUU61_005493 [Penicillium alfredii]|uniref:RING-type domain-containing protein n=1 Tax=Penicillium alfredii TaxID=1506179 RepID=A0A9W9K8P4_9EURO|nr:uncharacterized protein NUU61_005493 [Penicillium alfredii]KAJ5096137.1 hypothetical protein NUU61_005493 [Penicillium alfredii]